MMTSFTTYSLSHNIGASLLSGTIIRFRTYGSRGLSPGEIAVLVAVTSFTFLVGASDARRHRHGHQATVIAALFRPAGLGDDRHRPRAPVRGRVLPRRLAVPLQAADHRRLPHLLSEPERGDPPADHRPVRAARRRGDHLFLPARRGQSRLHHRRRGVRRLVLDGDRLARAGRPRRSRVRLPHRPRRHGSGAGARGPDRLPPALPAPARSPRRW